MKENNQYIYNINFNKNNNKSYISIIFFEKNHMNLKLITKQVKNIIKE